MKKIITILLLVSALLFQSTTVSANQQVYKDVTNATQNEILKKISAANIIPDTDYDYFRPGATVTRGELAEIIYRSHKLYNVRPAKEFHDVDEDVDYAEAIQALYRAGIIDGTADGYFNPYDEVKRTHVAKVLTNLLKLPPQRTTKFKDVPTTDANNGYIGALVQKGIIAGYENGTFRPNQFVTRMNMATFMYRVLYGKEPQIQNKKITSNLPYAATKLKSANYYYAGSSHYIEFDKKGNTIKPKMESVVQNYTNNKIQIKQYSSEWILANIDLRNLVEFKPYKKSSLNDLPYDFAYYSKGTYTTTPYFNQTVTINGLNFTGVLKVVQEADTQGIYEGEEDNYAKHEIIFYFKEGYGLLAQTFDDEVKFSITGYKLR